MAWTGHTAKMARRADATGHSRSDPGRMHAEVIRGITVRPLRSGETSVIQAVFDRLGPTSRLLRFGGAKAVLTPSDLEQLSRVDGDHHVLVAVVGGQPVGIARLVRQGTEAEVAIAVGDDWQQRGVGTLLADRLAADARAAGIERLRATMHAENRASMALMWRMARGLTTRCVAGQLEVVGRAT
jgi:GNAT superfamily N-acetyltransferase